MAYARRKVVDIHRSQRSPIGEDAISRIAQLYACREGGQRVATRPPRRTSQGPCRPGLRRRGTVTGNETDGNL
ncbi:MAG: hypothetical protein ACOH2H_25405, partial [Cypionkella sp.]